MDHELIGFQEGAGHGRYRVELVAGFVAQIQYQPLEGSAVSLLKVLDGAHPGLTAVLLERGDPDMAVTRFHQLVLDALDINNGPCDAEHAGLVLALAHDGEDDVRARFTAPTLDGVLDVHALHVRVVQLDDEIAALDAGLESWSVLDGGDHLNEAVRLGHLDAHAAEFTLRPHLQVLERVRIQIGRMGVEAGEHAVDGVGDELLAINRLNVVALEIAEHLAEGTQFIDR